jgi:hypothetical protein
MPEATPRGCDHADGAVDARTPRVSDWVDRGTRTLVEEMQAVDVDR